MYFVAVGVALAARFAAALQYQSPLSKRNKARQHTKKNKQMR